MPKFSKIRAEELRRVVEVLQGKWTIHILCVMFHGPVRFGQLRRSVPHASRKAITASLRSLEHAKLIMRRDLSGRLLHVEYELSEAVQKPLEALFDQLETLTTILSKTPRDRQISKRS